MLHIVIVLYDQIVDMTYDKSFMCSYFYYYIMLQFYKLSINLCQYSASLINPI